MTHHDLTVIAVMPVETSNGEVVHGQLKQLANQFGTPIATLSDRGSDLKKGVGLLQKEHPEVASFYDIVHLVSRAIKRIFENASLNPTLAGRRTEKGAAGAPTFCVKVGSLTSNRRLPSPKPGT